MNTIYRSPTNQHSPPLFSVFFKDFVFHRYSLKSLSSVIGQTIGTEEFEIILLTDQENVSEYMEMLTNHGINYTIIITGLISLGKSYGIFLDHCNGIFACPIDNDDTWSCERLAIFKKLILEHNDLTFIKNQINVVSELGNNFYTKLKFLIKMNIPIKVTNRCYLLNNLKSKKTLGRSLWHNVTSMVIKISVLQKFGDILDKIFAMDDPYIFFLGIFSGGSAIFVDKFLSSYLVRAHSKTLTDRDSSNLLKTSEEYQRFTRTFDEKCARDQNSPFCELYLIAKMTISLVIYNNNSEQPINWEHARKALKISINHRIYNYVFLYLYSLFPFS